MYKMISVRRNMPTVRSGRTRNKSRSGFRSSSSIKKTRKMSRRSGLKTINQGSVEKALLAMGPVLNGVSMTKQEFMNSVPNGSSVQKLIEGRVNVNDLNREINTSWQDLVRLTGSGQSTNTINLSNLLNKSNVEKTELKKQLWNIVKETIHILNPDVYEGCLKNAATPMDFKVKFEKEIPKDYLQRLTKGVESIIKKSQSGGGSGSASSSSNASNARSENSNTSEHVVYARAITATVRSLVDTVTAADGRYDIFINDSFEENERATARRHINYITAFLLITIISLSFGSLGWLLIELGAPATWRNMQSTSVALELGCGNPFGTTVRALASDYLDTVLGGFIPFRCSDVYRAKEQATIAFIKITISLILSAGGTMMVSGNRVRMLVGSLYYNRMARDIEDPGIDD